MPNSNYNRGRAFEYARKHYWESLGYVCLRTAGSRGFFDLIVLRGRTVILIQCKVCKTQAEALRLIKAFKVKPPLGTGQGYPAQCMEVWVKDTRILETGWADTTPSIARDISGNPMDSD